MRILHVIVTDNFAGAERYVATVARASAEAGCAVTVVGGREAPMRAQLGEAVCWLPGGGPLAAVRSVRRAGPQDICHVHLTYAEAVARLTQRWHGGSIVSTRHFAARRGSTRLGRLLAGWIAAGLSAEIAISRFVASALERPPTAVLPNGVCGRPNLWSPAHRVVLMLQRLEPEKETLTGLRAWQQSGLAERGWVLRLVGDGSQRAALEQAVGSAGITGVEFAGWQAEVDRELAGAALLLATAPYEPLGLSVIEAMSAGVPVLAAAGGGHLESIGLVDGAPLFVPGDHAGAGRQLAGLAADASRRSNLSERGRVAHREHFALAGHVEGLHRLYRAVLSDSSSPADEAHAVRGGA